MFCILYILVRIIFFACLIATVMNYESTRYYIIAMNHKSLQHEDFCSYKIQTLR